MIEAEIGIELLNTQNVCFHFSALLVKSYYNADCKHYEYMHNAKFTKTLLTMFLNMFNR